MRRSSLQWQTVKEPHCAKKHTRRVSDEDRSVEQYPVCEIVIRHQQGICPETEDKLHPDKMKLKFICKSSSSVETKVIPSFTLSLLKFYHINFIEP